ncbi:MAG: preprotein translocase subunit SecG [Planctomycetota bacterium]
MVLAATGFWGAVQTISAIFFAVIAILLMMVILLQRGRGVGLAGAFGGTGGATAFGAKTGDVLTWVTVVAAGFLLTFTVILNYVFVEDAPAVVARPGPTTPPPGMPAPVSGTPAPTPTGGGAPVEVPLVPMSPPQGVPSPAHSSPPAPVSPAGGTPPAPADTGAPMPPGSETPAQPPAEPPPAQPPLPESNAG